MVLDAEMLAVGQVSGTIVTGCLCQEHVINCQDSQGQTGRSPGSAYVSLFTYCVNDGPGEHAQRALTDLM